MRRLLALAAVLALTACTAAPTAGPAPAPTSWTVDWDRVAWCEAGGNWTHHPVTNSHGTFSGGLMWNHRYWLAAGGGEFARYPYQASRLEQIIISERHIDGSYAKADAAWQCIGGPARSGV